MGGRTTEPRSVTITTTSASTAITGAAGTFEKTDAGRSITGTGIPAGATVASVTSKTAAVLSAAATASGSRSVTIGTASTPTTVLADGQRYGFIGWSPESEDEADSYTVAANNAGVVAPDRITNPNTRVSQRTYRS